MHRRAIIFCLLLSTVASAETVKVDILLGGKPIGTNTWTESPDGTVDSVTKISVQGVNIDSHLTGHLVKGQLDDCVLEEGMGTRKGKAVWKDDSLDAWQNNTQNAKGVKTKLRGKPFFASYHPMLWQTVWRSCAGKPPADGMDVVNINSFAPIKMKFSVQATTAETESGAKSVEIWSTDVAGTQMQLAFTSAGKILGMNVPSQDAQFVLNGFKGVFVDPLSKYPELSQPTFKTATLERVRMPMRDGVNMMADISRPLPEGRYPTILIRTPYGRQVSLMTMDWLVKRGYVVVSQDVRGRGGSDGDFDPLVWEKKDGYDTIDWITKQPWSDGKVGMIGGSYLGYVQWAAAASGHPGLKCIVPQVSPPEPDKNFPWDNGAFMLISDIWWTRVVFDRSSNTSVAFDPMKNLKSLKALPLTQVDNEFHGKNLTFWDSWVRRSSLSDWGDVFTTEDVSRVKIPVLHVSGVWDGDGAGTMIHWQALRGHGNQWLIFGPWTHLFNSATKVGDIDYGSKSVLELNSVYLRFFDEFLKDKTVGMEKLPRVRFFLTGTNAWLTGPDWPLPQETQTTWYLSGGKANGSAGDGQLSDKPGKGRDQYIYDPNNVAFRADSIDVNVGGGTTTVPKSEFKDNVLIYRTEPFATPSALTGPLRAELYVSTTAKDATFHVTVGDQSQSGDIRIIGMTGTDRVTYQDGKWRSIQPNKVYKITVQPWWFAHQFEKGHRLVVMVQSDMYPRFARNPGTGVPDWQATKLVKATQSVWKDAKHPSRITLWKL